MKKIIALMSCVFVLLLVSCAQNATEQYLSNLKPVSVKGSYLNDMSPEKHPIYSRGIGFRKGICVNSASELSYNLDGNYATFSCVVCHHDDYPEYEGLVVFTVLADGNKIYESSPMGVEDNKGINIKIKDVKVLTLKVKDTGMFTSYALWADAKVLK